MNEIVWLNGHWFFYNSIYFNSYHSAALAYFVFYVVSKGLWDSLASSEFSEMLFSEHGTLFSEVGSDIWTRYMLRMSIRCIFHSFDRNRKNAWYPKLKPLWCYQNYHRSSVLIWKINSGSSVQPVWKTLSGWFFKITITCKQFAPFTGFFWPCVIVCEIPAWKDYLLTTWKLPASSIHVF